MIKRNIKEKGRNTLSFNIVRQDITQMKVDAIVNAANTGLQQGSGVCGAIFSAAGPREMQDACDKLSPIQTGEAVITPGFALPARYVIHTAGPIYDAGQPDQSEKLLRSAYTQSLQLAVENHCESIAFPLISSGIFGYPKAEALQVATSAIEDFLAQHDLEVYLAVFDKKSFVVSEELLGEVDDYLDENYVRRHRGPSRKLKEIATDYECTMIQADEFNLPSSASESRKMEKFGSSVKKTSLGPDIGSIDEPFNKTLQRLIKAKGKTEVEVYKKANMDRRLFSKIRKGPDYIPSKRNVLALCIALELDIDEAEDLLECAGYALSHSIKFDVIVEYFIENKKYDIYHINEVLFKYDQPLLGLLD
jgi:O-acetyl-ADP-ribose deacetylase (regulator of RNase III)